MIFFQLFLAFFAVIPSFSALVPNKKTATTVFEQYKSQGISALSSGRLLLLDPLVGDTACQIRAVYFADLYTKAKQGVDLAPEQYKALAYGALLTDIKKYEGDRSLVLKDSLDKKMLGISNKEADKLIKEARLFLATLSVSYVQSLAEEIPFEKQQALVKKALSKIVFPGAKPVVACYPGVVALLNKVKMLKMPIVVRYDVVATIKPLYIQAFSLSDSEYAPTEIEKIDKKLAAFVLGVLVPKASFAYTGSIEHMIVMQAALHQQFAGKENAAEELPYDEFDCTLKKAREELIQEGSSMSLSRENPDPFYIYHTHVATIAELLGDISLNSQSKEECE